MLKVLVVDDSQLLARAISDVLCEHEVTVDRDCQSALARIVDAEVDGRPYDLVVCEAHLRQCRALESLAVVRSLERSPMFLVIAGDPELADSSADAVLLKPFAPQELRALVTCLAAARATSKMRRSERALV